MPSLLCKIVCFVLRGGGGLDSGGHCNTK